MYVFVILTTATRARNRVRAKKIRVCKLIVRRSSII